jgi:hypothetical protein
MKEAVARIVSRFGNKLVAFKFAPATAQRLQAFVDVSVSMFWSLIPQSMMSDCVDRHDDLCSRHDEEK